MLHPPLPAPCSHFAKYFISLVDEEAGDSISNLKLQKLLYYAQGFHLAMHGKPLFVDAIKAWAHGPVVPNVYHDYKHCGSGPIKVESVNPEDYSRDVRTLLDEVYDVYGQFSASKLRTMTHNEPPWKDTPQNAVIPLDAMERFFKTLLVYDEDQAPAAEHG